MVLEYIAGVGPFQAVTNQPYRVGNAGKLSDLGITTVTIAGKHYFRWDGTAATSSNNVGVRVTSLGSSEQPVDQTFRWAPVAEFRIEGAFGAVGDVVHVLLLGSGTRLQLALVCTTDTSHYKIRLMQDMTTIIGTGSTEYAVGTTFRAIRAESDGATVTLHVDDSEEFSVSNTSEIAGSAIALFVDADLQNGQTIHVRNIQLSQSNDRADRPGHQDMTGGIITLAGDKVSAEYGSHTGTCVDGSATEAHWDDWETGDADDVTTNNCMAGGSAGREVSEMSDPATTNLYGVQVWLRGRANVDAKTVDVDIIIEDTAGNIRSRSQENFGTDVWRQRKGTGFSRGPGIDGWTELKLHDTGVGVRSPDTNGANDQHTAIMVEWFGIGSDPPPAASGRRRLLAA